MIYEKDFENSLSFDNIPSIDDLENFEEVVKSKYLVKNNKIIQENCGQYCNIFIKHKSELIEESSEEPKNRKIITRISAYKIKCKNPITYESLIGAAESQEYSSNDINCINRISRKNPEDPRIIAYDNFIEFIKEGLNEIGYFDPSNSEV